MGDEWHFGKEGEGGGKYPSPKINEALSTGTIEVVWNVSSLAISSRSFNWYAQTQRFQHVMNQYPLSTPYFTQILCNTYGWLMCPPLPTSFHRVSAVFTFRYSDKRVGPYECDQHQRARDTWEIKETRGDSAKERWNSCYLFQQLAKNWAWWGHCYLFNTGSLKLLPLPFPLSPLPSFPLPTPIWKRDSGSY